MHLINASGYTIAINNDNGPACSGISASIARNLIPGVYYVVSEGSGTGAGTVNLNLSIPALPSQPDLFAQLSTAMQHMELSRIPYGLLQDIAVEQIELDNHRGVLLGDSTLVTHSLFNSIYTAH